MNSTIIKKRKICKSCNRSTYIFSKGNCKECSIIKSTSNRTKKYNDEIEDESLKNLKEDLDIIFSKYIRLKEADVNGFVYCITCNEKNHYTNTDAGHFISRMHLSTRWDENNAKPQCKKCNRLEYGMSEKFAKKLNELQPGLAEYLKEQSNIVAKPTRDELKELLIQYRYKLKIISKKIK